MSVETAIGGRSPFNAGLHQIRGQQGQIDAAIAYRDMLTETSEIGDSHKDGEKVQDP